MGVFICVSSLSKNEANKLQSIADSLVRYVHIEHQCMRVYSLNQGHCYLIDFAVDNALYKIEDQIHIISSNNEIVSLTIINGYCWFETGSGGEVLSAVDLHNLIESKDRNVEQIRNQLSGEYSVVHIYDNGNILAFNDNLGIEHIYYSEAPNQYIITNRVSLIDVIQPKYSYDYLGMLWMQTIGYLIGEHTYRQDVRSLSQGGSLKITQGGLHLLENPHWLFPEGTIDNRGWKHISDFQIETAIESAMANVNILSRKNQDILELGITGGKDSRVVLALC
ncbi:hypothetical protein V6O07_01255, partial [Arthrospira platensis SPKY2]